MQKLYWQNAKGQTVDLTAEPYGITEWEGFANTELNVQTQQVPFNDGGVYLDALMEQRELSVTLAIKDKNILEDRYRLRRELIASMNPKLGEGYLIYENDFLKKQIKCLPYIPQFENHNSNTKGTPKASLTWLACEPYWEDVEETKIHLQSGSRIIVNYSGDVPTDVTVDMYTDNVTNPKFKNFTEDCHISLSGNFTTDINIKTATGQKEVTTRQIFYKNVNDGIGLNEVIYVDSLEMFVGVGSSILTSTDCVTWTPRVFGVTMRSVCYSKSQNLFVAVGNNTNNTVDTYTSTDGINWTLHSFSSPRTIYSVCYSEHLNLFVMVGQYGNVYTSEDGETWTNSTPASYDFTEIIWCEEKSMFLASCGSVYTSTNGVNWTSHSANVKSVCYSKSLDLFVGVGSNGSVYTSTDGSTWTSRTSGTSDNLVSVLYSEETHLFVAVGSACVTSADGINWSVITEDFSAKWIIYAQTLGLYFADTYVSTNAVEWKVNKQSITSYSVCYSDKLGLFVCAGNAGTAATSADGINWTYTENAIPNLIYAVYYAEGLGLFVCGGYNGALATSQDGINWQTVTSGTTESITSFCYSNKLGLLVGIGSNGLIIKSTDGVNWDIVSSGISVYLNKIIYSETLELFVAVGNGGSVYTSTDGSTWASRTSGTTNNLYGVAYSDTLRKFVCVGTSITITSVNGVNWIAKTNTNDLRSVCYAEALGVFFTVGVKTQTGVILKSVDGINWSGEQIGYTTTFQSVSYSQKLSRFVFTGINNNTLFYSDFSSGENIIASLTSDSDMGLSLEHGDNKLLLSADSGYVHGTLTYRQKYIGV